MDEKLNFASVAAICDEIWGRNAADLAQTIDRDLNDCIERQWQYVVRSIQSQDRTIRQLRGTVATLQAQLESLPDGTGTHASAPYCG